MNTITTDPRIEAMLHTLDHLTSNLDHALRVAEHSAAKARKALREGNRTEGMGGMTSGPLGHQVPFDIATTCAKIEATLQALTAMGATQEQITAAYKVA